MEFDSVAFDNWLTTDPAEQDYGTCAACGDEVKVWDLDENNECGCEFHKEEE